MTAALLLPHVASTLAMVGLIWFVQVVHYPLMAHVGVADFTGYEAAHVRATSWVVIPLMLTEVATAVGLCLAGLPAVPVAEAALGLTLLAGVWVSTFALQVPLHGTLEQRFDPAAHQALVRSNWIRTALWSARGALVLWWLARALA